MLHYLESMYLVACEESSPPVFDVLDRSSSAVLYFLQLGQKHEIFVIIHILFIQPVFSFFKYLFMKDKVRMET